MKNVSSILLFFVSFILFSQNEAVTTIDSLERILPQVKEDSQKVNNLNDLSAKYQFIDAEKGLGYGKEALSLSKKINWDEGISKSQLSIGANHYFLLDFPEALEAFEEVLKTTTDKAVRATTLKSIGLVYSSQSNYNKSLEYYFKALSISEDLNDKGLNSKLFANIGTDYARMGDNEKAIQNYLKALKINEELDNKIGQSLNLQNIGNLYFLQDQEDLALDFIQKSMDINEAVGNKKGKIYNLESLTDIQISKSNFAAALDLTNQALFLSKEIKDEESEAYESTQLGAINFQLGKNQKSKLAGKKYFDDAEYYYLKAISIHLKMKNLQELALDYEELSKIQNYRDNYKASLDSYTLSIKYRDSVFNSENKETIKNLEDQREIELRDKQIELNNLTIETNKKVKLFLIGGLSLLAIIGTLLFYQGYLRKKNNEKLNLLNLELNKSNKIKNHLLIILNHDLRSPINRLIHFLQILKTDPEILDEESKNGMIDKNMADAEILLKSMDDILLWSKAQMAIYGPKMIVVSVESLFEDTKDYFTYLKNIDLQFQNTENLYIETDKDYLKTIIRNLTINSIKALTDISDPIIWKAWTEGNEKYLSITDNGIGMNSEQSSPLFNDQMVYNINTGFGLHLVRDLAKSIYCEIIIESKPNIGTTFILKFTP